MLHSPEGALSPVRRSRTLGVVVAAVFLAGCGGSSSSTSPPPPPNPTPPPAGGVSIKVDAANRHQVIEGFGASTEQWSDCGNDQMGASRQASLDAIYKEIKLTMGDLHVNPYVANTSSTQLVEPMTSLPHSLRLSISELSGHPWPQRR